MPRDPRDHLLDHICRVRPAAQAEQHRLTGEPLDDRGRRGQQVIELAHRTTGGDAGPVSSEVVRTVIVGLRTLAAELHAGLTLQRYDAGSLSLAMKETLTLLEAA
ncbi:MAG: hypothetical protein JWL97_4080 [Gemmatimonadales bacterium]|jgi:hypothetical protein|nr:hypothetical protein [Gemmatimonadales bacterium]